MESGGAQIERRGGSRGDGCADRRGWQHRLLVSTILGLGTLAPGLVWGAPPGAGAAERFDAALLELRVVLALVALALYVAGLRRRRRSEPAGSGRRLLLAMTALVAFAANYNFFVRSGLHQHELYHYYLGSKYFPELSYTGLYTCSVQAVHGEGVLPAEIEEMTDLVRKDRTAAAEVMRGARRCELDFEPARWAAFRADVGAFRAWMGETGWRGVLRDHGYNPSPAWTLVGRPLASLVPPTPWGLLLLARIDLALLGLLFAAIAWSFGFEAVCLAAVAWGASGHTRYQWTGDAMLRQLWLTTSVLGICLLRWKRPAAAGAFFSFAALERVFPGAFLLGYGARELAVWLRERSPGPGLLRFAAGAALASVLVIASATAVGGRGFAAWGEFADNTRALLSFTPRNTLGLDYALGFTLTRPPDWVEGDRHAQRQIIERHKRRTIEARRVPRGLLLVAFAVLFVGVAWRGARGSGAGRPRLEAWEAAAMGTAAIPFFTVAGCYYVGFILVGALLATRRPRIGIALLLAVAGFAASIVAYGSRGIAFAWSSGILVAYSLWMLVELWLPPVDSPDDGLSDSGTPGIIPRPGSD